MAKQVIGIGSAANDGTGDPLRTAFDKVNDNFDEVYGADFVDYDKLGTEFTTAAVISASDVDFSSAAVFTKTISGNTTLTFSNVETGMVKDLVITGAYTLALPASVKTIKGTYDG